MSKHNTDILIFGGDQRLIHAADILKNEHHYPIDAYIDKPLPLLSKLGACETIIVPVPFSTDGETVYTPMQGHTVSIENFFAQINENVHIIGGTIPDTYKNRIPFYYDITKDIEFINRNLQPTVEGIIQYLLNHIEYTLASSRIMIIGYGRLGKLLAAHLQGFGADITACCSNAEEISAAGNANLRPCKIGTDGDYEHQDIIVNTVPAPVITEAELKRIRATTLLVEVASVPGGFDSVVAEKIGLNFTILRGIPGKKAPKTAGRYISMLIDKKLGEWERK